MVLVVVLAVQLRVVIPEMRETAAAVSAERAADGERLRLLEAAREREVVQIARLLVELEEARRLVAKLKREARGD